MGLLPGRSGGSGPSPLACGAMGSLPAPGGGPGKPAHGQRTSSTTSGAAAVLSNGNGGGSTAHAAALSAVLGGAGGFRAQAEAQAEAWRNAASEQQRATAAAEELVS